MRPSGSEGGETAIKAVFPTPIGLPRALYVDRDSIYRASRDPTTQEVLAGKKPTTQFGRAMDQLGVEIIMAHSPQAKGRVERMNGTLQNRLVKEMRLAKIKDIAQANIFLERKFLPAFNARFTVVAAEGLDFHQRLAKGPDLSSILCIRESRKVGEDWCVLYANRVFQLGRIHQGMALAGRKITVVEKADGSITLLNGSHALQWKELQVRVSVQGVVAGPAVKWRPPTGHPWRGGPAVLAPARAAPSPTPGRELL